MNAFDDNMELAGLPRLTCQRIDTLQVNVGRKCNQACAHCHQEAGPDRDELMDWGTMEQVIAAADVMGDVLVDITGGAPELNPHLRRFVTQLRTHGHPVMVRTNLTCLQEPEGKGMAEFYAEQGVELIASLNCYEEEEVRIQRGEGVFERSLTALRTLNQLGYGTGGELVLDLVYNHIGACLPPPQDKLEDDYHRILQEEFGITFDHLFTITNMPIGRFRRHLEETGQMDDYMALLRDGFNAETVDPLMCRTQVCVRWDGALFDCDFNMARGMPVDCPTGHVAQFDPRALEGRPIVTADHCLGCTAGSGSSCGGALL
ncbi:MAG: arsenosugar biosynthesis radical SAM protein ArsS [Thermoplasmata archaeon]|nr:MAG: arsenosugar biosynthesis radical SAM protein ArsS [Thermoplasmata archaeon]